MGSQVNQTVYLAFGHDLSDGKPLWEFSYDSTNAVYQFLPLSTSCEVGSSAKPFSKLYVTDLNVADDLTVTDDVTISGDLDIAGELTTDDDVIIDGQVRAYEGINYVAATGTDTLTGSISGLTSYVDGLIVVVKSDADSTAGVTLNISSVGAKKILKGSDGSTQVGSGEIKANVPFIVVYNSSLDSSNGAFVHQRL